MGSFKYLIAGSIYFFLKIQSNGTRFAVSSMTNTTSAVTEEVTLMSDEMLHPDEENQLSENSLPGLLSMQFNASNESNRKTFHSSAFSLCHIDIYILMKW